MRCDWLAEAGINKLRGKLSWRVGVPPVAVPSLARVYESIPTWVCLIRVAFHCASAVSCSFRLALNHNERRSACGGQRCALWGDFSWGSRGSASTSHHSLLSSHLDVLSLSLRIWMFFCFLSLSLNGPAITDSTIGELHCSSFLCHSIFNPILL